MITRDMIEMQINLKNKAAENIINNIKMAYSYISVYDESMYKITENWKTSGSSFHIEELKNIINIEEMLSDLDKITYLAEEIENNNISVNTYIDKGGNI